MPQPKLDITEYRIHKCTCPICGIVNKGKAPIDVKAPVQYGKGVKSFVVLLNVYYKLPVKKIQTLFQDLFGYSINETSIQTAGEQCYVYLEETEAIIREKTIQQQVVNVDETGLRVKGNLHWLHTASTNCYTYLFVHKNRGEKALTSEKSILENFKGWLIHDCWSSYFKFTGAKHALCGAHILRELEGLIESRQCTWARVFKKFLLKLFETPFEERIKYRNIIIEKYDRICSLGNNYEPPPEKLSGKRGRYKRTKGRNLLERLISEKESILAFAFNYEVPFTNNLAERDIRPAKLKISNCFRTENGANIYARIEGFLSTVRKNNRNVFTELYATFEGKNFISR
jgi:transposase